MWRRILHGVYRLPDIDEYLNIPWCGLYEKEREFYWSTDMSHVLNTLVFALVDYNPSAFFSMVNIRSVSAYNRMISC